MQWILFNAGHEPELQSYTAAVSLLSLSPVCMLNCLSGSGAEAAECEVVRSPYLGNIVGGRKKRKIE